ncbi:MAG: AAA family ATPase [Candidatus Peribacteria bacterium]|nr:AAA family ATPase [Candidatus Peribacteria bacterium]
MLKSIIQEITSKHKILENNIFYIDKDIPQFKNINNYDKLNKTFQEFLKKIDKNKKIIVAIDEVQEIQEWELFVNGYLTQYQNKIEIFIT